MARITLEGPDAAILYREDVLRLLRVSESTLDRMIRDGAFPSGIKAGASSPPFWTATDIACWLHLAPRLVAQDEARGGRKDSESARRDISEKS